MLHVSSWRRRITSLLGCCRPSDRSGSGGIDVAALAALVGRTGATILEIGCHDGFHTRQFLKEFDSPTIYCFEPEPRAVGRFRAALKGARSVHLLEAAVGARTGKTVFYRSTGSHPDADGRPMPEGWDYSGSIRRPRRHREKYPLVEFGETIEVPMVSIDDWVIGRGIERIDLVWMDVQGAEGDVLRGMERTLPHVRFLYTEFSDEELYEGQSGLAEILHMAAGFEVVTRLPGDVLLRRI